MSITQQLGAISIVVSAIGVTVGLAWSNAITAIINHYIPDEANSKSMWIKIAYAVGLTILAGGVSKIIDRYSRK